MWQAKVKTGPHHEEATFREQGHRTNLSWRGPVPHPSKAFMPSCAEQDPASPFQFIINTASGSADGHAKREVIEQALGSQGRRGDVRMCRADELARMSREAAAKALRLRTTVVAVGGDGTRNTVAQAAGWWRRTLR
jgi:hypothetical protein